MPRGKRRRTPGEKASQRWRTRNNKIKRITKALEGAGGKAVKILNERLIFWQNK